MAFQRSVSQDVCMNSNPEGTSNALHKMFTAALLLTGNCAAAEFSVTKALQAATSTDLLGPGVFRTIINIAVKAEKFQAGDRTSAEERRLSSWLPRELQRLLLLSTIDRQAFVLRLILGLAADHCSELLQLQDGELDRRIVSASLRLARIEAEDNQLPETLGNAVLIGATP